MGILVFHNPVAVNVGKHKENHTLNSSPASLLFLNVFWYHGWRHRADLNALLCLGDRCRSFLTEILCCIGLTMKGSSPLCDH